MISSSLSATVFTVLSFSLCSAAEAAPQVNIGKTILVGRDVTALKQDFFGGEEDILP